MHIQREQLAWAAGLFEGEGCFTGQVCNGRFFYPKAFLVMTDYDTVVRFQETIGFGSFVARPPRKPTHKPQLELNICSFEHFQQLVCYLWPWLGERRKARIKELFLKCYEFRR